MHTHQMLKLSKGTKEYEVQIGTMTHSSYTPSPSPRSGTLVLIMGSPTPGSSSSPLGTGGLSWGSRSESARREEKSIFGLLRRDLGPNVSWKGSTSMIREDCGLYSQCRRLGLTKTRFLTLGFSFD
jgi:hypothetical protein